MTHAIQLNPWKDSPLVAAGFARHIDSGRSICYSRHVCRLDWNASVAFIVRVLSSSRTIASAGFWSSVRNILQNLPSYESAGGLLWIQDCVVQINSLDHVAPWKISSVGTPNTTSLFTSFLSEYTRCSFQSTSTANRLYFNPSRIAMARCLAHWK